MSPGTSADVEVEHWSTLENYASKYDHVAIRRIDGILELRLHSEGGPLVWGAGPHSELGACFADVARDPETRVVILTGTGDQFISRLDRSWVGAMTPDKWRKIYFNGKRLLDELLGIEVPVIAAINGPARVHAELAVLSDITIASDTTLLQDAPHFRFNTVPGDGVQVVWEMLLGLNRGRYFLLTGQKLSAAEAQALGVVNEVLPQHEVLDRAWELARELCRRSDSTLRFTRVALIDRLRATLRSQVGYGLALEGINAFETWPAE
jgi:enoyl-CoA hydratase/carnithine racemase